MLENVICPGNKDFFFQINLSKGWEPARYSPFKKWDLTFKGLHGDSIDHLSFFLFIYFLVINFGFVEKQRQKSSWRKTYLAKIENE